MKKHLLLILTAFGLLLTSCSTQEEQERTVAEDSVTPVIGSASSAESEENATISATEIGSNESITSSTEDCDKFLSDYEAYADSYTALAAKYAKNPADISVMQEYTDMAAKAQEMQENKPDVCGGNKDFYKRYSLITAKVSKAAAVQAQSSAKIMEQLSKASK